MIYEVEGQFVISSHRTWMPGIYVSRRAANYAFRFTDETLSELGKKGPITFEMLQSAREEDKAIRASWLETGER